MPNIGPMEILVVLMVALIVLGPKRLPEAGRQLGKAIGEVRKWSNTMQAEVKAVLDSDLEAEPPPAVVLDPEISPAPAAAIDAAVSQMPDPETPESPPPVMPTPPPAPST